MSTPRSAKRDRKRLNKAGARAAQLEATRKLRRRQALTRAAVLGVLVAVLAVVAALVFGRDTDGKKVAAEASKDKDNAAESTTTSSATTPTTVNPALAAINCDDRKPEAKANRPTFDKPPAMTIDPAKKYTATIDTNCGKITIALDPKAAPKTVNNFVFLGRQGFYDGLTWHRVVKDFVIQGGDPKGDGTGGPSYQFEDELLTDGYKIGSVAMANSGPDTNGSQFFVVTGQNGASLPNSYSRFGMVTEGVEVAQKLESFAPDPPDPSGKPSRPLYMFKIEITESAA